jgi:flagellar basal-body rod protein FlgB
LPETSALHGKQLPPSGCPAFKTGVFGLFLALASPLLSRLGKVCMIDALFNNPNYLAAKKTLDAVALRQEAISNNIANLETPGYRRVDLSPSFKAELERALNSGKADQLSQLKPKLSPDMSAVASSRDGNTVNFESEMLQLNQNSLAHAVETQLISSALLRLKLAITGKS